MRSFLQPLSLLVLESGQEKKVTSRAYRAVPTPASTLHYNPLLKMNDLRGEEEKMSTTSAIRPNVLPYSFNDPARKVQRILRIKGNKNTKRHLQPVVSSNQMNLKTELCTQALWSKWVFLFSFEKCANRCELHHIPSPFLTLPVDTSSLPRPACPDFDRECISVRKVRCRSVRGGWYRTVLGTMVLYRGTKGVVAGLSEMRRLIFLIGLLR
jgi:hypothetical protein